MEEKVKVRGKDKSEGKRSQGKDKEKVKVGEIGIKENKKDDVREKVQLKREWRERDDKGQHEW